MFKRSKREGLLISNMKLRIEKNHKKRKELISKKNTICDQIFHKILMETQKEEDSIERISITT